MARRRGLTPEERELWSRIARTATPLHPDRPSPSGQPFPEPDQPDAPPPVAADARDPTDRFVSSLDDPANATPPPAFELPSRRPGGAPPRERVPDGPPQEGAP